MGRKLYVGNLAFAVTDQDLQGLFADAGACESVAVVMDRDTGRSRGFGFVEMGSEADAEKAIGQLNGREFMGRALNVSEARARENGGGDRRGGWTGGGGSRDGGGRGGWGSSR
jgi:cold-inducible RNA-binding protein